MDRFRYFAEAPDSSERRASPNRDKSTCPYCFLEIYVCELRQHLDSCPIFHFSQVQEDSPQLPSLWQITSSPRQYSDEFEESSDTPLAVTSRFLSPDQTFESQESEEECEETSKGNPQAPESALCPICFSEYSKANKLPIVLPSCGHTICHHCIRRIYRENAMVPCPVCRAEHFDEVSEFPVNWAVLELAENRQHRKGCELHGQEAVAFCGDHGNLLCGLCVYEHKDHRSFLLDSEEAFTYTQRLKESLGDTVTRLEVFLSSWEATSELLESLSVSVKNALDRHFSQLRHSEEELIDTIRAGKNACIEQLRTLLETRGPASVQVNCSSEVLRISRDLQLLHDNRTHFDSLSIAEQLRTALFYKPENYPKPPPLTHIRDLTALLNTEVDYERAIRERRLLTK